jgi:hypothetical protein
LSPNEFCFDVRGYAIASPDSGNFDSRKIEMQFTGKIASFVVPLVATALLSACSGGGGSPALQPSGDAALQAHSATSAQSVTSRAVTPFKGGPKCKASGTVKATPCPIALTITDPVQTIAVTAGASDTITEKDNCAKNGIALVVGADGTYVVTAGLASGSCVAKFTATNGKKHDGKATVPISNTLL